MFALRDGTLGRLDDDDFDPLRFIAPTSGVSATEAVADGDRERYRFMPSDAGGVVAPPYVVRVRDGESWSYNDGPSDPPGPDRADWDKHAGDYALVTRDGLTGRIPVANRDGHLYVASQRIYEDRDYLFTPRGEHVTLDGELILVGSRTLERIR